MKKLILPALATALLAMLVIGTTSAQVKKGKSRPLQTKNLMKGVVASNCGALKKALEAGPSDDKAWAAVVMHAELLNGLEESRGQGRGWCQVSIRSTHEGVWRLPLQA